MRPILSISRQPFRWKNEAASQGVASVANAGKELDVKELNAFSVDVSLKASPAKYGDTFSLRCAHADEQRAVTNNKEMNSLFMSFSINI